jgi:hypothetical protein
MFMFFLAMISMALCISSCVQQPRWVNVASILLLFVTIFVSVFQVIQPQNYYYTYVHTYVYPICTHLY